MHHVLVVMKTVAMDNAPCAGRHGNSVYGQCTMWWSDIGNVDQLILVLLGKGQRVPVLKSASWPCSLG
jgi:hypothetical protein